VNPTVLLGLLLAFCFGTSDYLSKGVTKQVGAYRTAVLTLALSGLLLLGPAPLMGSFTIGDSTTPALLLLLSVSTFLAFFFMYRGYRRGKLSVISPTVNSFPIFSVALSVFLLKVSLSTTVLVALCGVIGGVLLVSTSFSEIGASRRRDLTPGLPDGIIAALFFGISLTALGYAEQTIGYLLPIFAARLGAAAVGFLVAIPLKERVWGSVSIPWRRLSAMGLLEFGGLSAFSLALIHSGDPRSLPIITTMGGMGVLFTVGYAFVLLKETSEANHRLGIALLIVSVGALLYLTA